MRNLLLPPIVWLAAIATMIIAHQSYPIVHWEPNPARTGIGVALGAVAVAVTVWHKRLFRRVGTNVNTFSSPDKLVEAGLFRHLRNPMYLGFVVALAALAWVSGALSPWFIVAGFFLLADRWYIPVEERAMSLRFGAEYEAYRNRTRRWI
jgi:protein-S-isoprenylcysteine O-methyltransferase Ste14